MFNTLKNKIKRLPRAAKLAPLALVTILAIPALSMAWGPSRPTFDYNKYDASDPTCRAASNDHGRCGSMTGPVFNSFVNVPGYGDERNFVTISQATPGDTNPVDNSYTDEMTAVPGQEYWVRVYIHNNANSATNNEDLNHDGFPDGVARNTRVSFNYVDGRANAHDLKAVVSADNATPTQVWDEAVLRNNDEQFRPQYVNGSAILVNGKHTPSNPQPLSDAIASPGGVQIGYDQMDGNLPGCFDYQARVYVKVVVKAPKILVKKEAFVSGTQQIVNNQTVDPKTSITYKAFFYNIGNDDASDVTLKDTLPAGNTFTSGTLKLYTGAALNGLVQNSGQENAFFNAGGIDLGNYAPLTDAARAKVLANTGDPSQDPYSGLLTYKTSIATDNSTCQIVNTVAARIPGGNESTSSTTVNVSNKCQEEKCKTPGFENLPANSPECVRCSGHPELAANSPKCNVAPTALPNTGPGDVAGLFGAVTVAGAMFHRFVLSRKNS